MKSEGTPMQESQFRELENELRREIDIAVSRANGGSKMWRVSQIVIMASSVLLTAIIIPWGVWVTRSINDARQQVALLENWRSQRPQFVTTADLENNRFRILTEVNEKVDQRLVRLHDDVSSVKDLLTTHMLNEKVRP